MHLGTTGTLDDFCSAGITMWEIWTGGDMPYGRMHNPEVVEKVCHQNYRLSRPSACPAEVYDIMKDCWRGVSSGFRFL